MYLLYNLVMDMLKVTILTVLSIVFEYLSFDMFSSPLIEKDPNDASIFVPLNRTFLFLFFSFVDCLIWKVGLGYLY